MKICFDLDETLCTGKPYKDAVPITSSIEVLNRLKEDGHIIIIYTARGMTTFNGDHAKVIAEYEDMTIAQLKSWNVKYDSLIFGKPSADVYIDDKALNINDLDKLESRLEDSPFKQCCKRLDNMLDKITSVIDSSILEDSDGRK